MALDAAAIKQKITDVNVGARIANGESSDSISTAIMTAYATAIIDHFKSNAEVLPNGTPAMAAGGDAVTGKGKIV